ncbi:hypothetical protein GCM10027341_15280 [Spirosoma knui]
MLLLSAPLLAQTWTGATNTDWSNPNNWIPSNVPTADSDVIIPEVANSPVIGWNTAALANSVHIEFKGALTISSSATLTINGSMQLVNGSKVAFYSRGTVVNNGLLSIGATTSSADIGLYNRALFTNGLGSQLQINGFNSMGLLNGEGTFTNAAQIVIGDKGSIGDVGIQNMATFNTTPDSQISLNNCSSAGLLNHIGSFTNSGRITIGAIGSVSVDGLYNSGSFSNLTGGYIQIDRSSYIGLWNTGNTFINSGNIIIGANAPVGEHGLVNGSVFYNMPGGQLHIDNATKYGLANGGKFNNSDRVIIGAKAAVGQNALFNSNVFTNVTSCASLTMHASLNNSGTLTNQGLMTVKTTQEHTNSYLTNNGTLVYPQGNPIPNVSNNKLIALPLSTDCGLLTASPALQIGINNNLLVGSSWYKDAGLTTVAGTYTANTFTATNPVSADVFPVYFTVTDPVNYCPQTVSVPVTVNVSPQAALTNSGPLSFTNTPVTLSTPSSPAYSYSFSLGATQQGTPNTATVTTPGVYSVTVTNANGCTAIASTTVLGGNSPTVCRGGTAVINVVVAGSPVKYEWYKNSLTTPKIMESPQLFRGTATSSLTLINAQSNTQGNFYLKATDQSGTVSIYGPYRLTVDGSCRAREVAQPETPWQVELAPNPIQQDRLRAVVRGAEGRSLQVELIDLSGKPIRQQRWQQAESQQVIDWDLQAQSSGLYLLQVISEAGASVPAQRQSLKVIKL